tara:strand:+ start:313 stop:699 length:387 start_codon:yes stop_codon:yes gene_type:complete
MKILGIGVDIVNNKRFKKLIKNKNFLKRTYSVNEIQLSIKKKDKVNFFAKRFAAKESLAKALGTGFRKKLNLKEIEIYNNNLGKPFYNNNKKLNNFINKIFGIKSYNLFLSISDEKDYSIAFTILQKK